jgi:fructuronate reductase
MRLDLTSILEDKRWEGSGCRLPAFDVKAVRRQTAEHPGWLHLGAGNIFRAYIAVLAQRMLERGLTDTGIIVCEAFDEQIIEQVYRPFDDLSIAVTLKSSGEAVQEVVASVTESVIPSSGYDRLKEIFTSGSLQLVSLTITEKGYAITDSSGTILPWIEADVMRSDGRAQTTIGLLTELLYDRYRAEALPLALVSLDNCSHNGSLLKEAVMTFCERRTIDGYYDEGFREYLSDEMRISFCWSMIDKITPRPSPVVEQLLERAGIEGMKSIHTQKNTFIAPFVNAEESEYMAIEDRFPNGRPPLEEVGVLFGDRQTIDRIEKMKVCTCLNPLHTVLAIYGCLLGFSSISDEMQDPMLKRFIERLGYDEGMPVVVDPGIISAQQFIKETIEVRFPNPFVPDTPSRIATDTSKKIPIRFGQTLRAYMAAGHEDLSFLTFIPLFFAGWLRYLMGVDDQGEPFEISADPNLEELQAHVKGISLGSGVSHVDQLQPLLSNPDYFGVDLYGVQLGKKVEGMFTELTAGKGAIRSTLRHYLQEQGGGAL